MTHNLKVVLATLIAIVISENTRCMAPPHPKQKPITARVLPVHFSEKDNQWYGLFAKNMGLDLWTDFGTQYHSTGKANIHAAKALKDGTSGLYDVTIEEQFPWGKKTLGGYTHIFHFVPVKERISGSTLYSQAGPKGKHIKDDFAWIPIKDVINKKNMGASVTLNLQELIESAWSSKIEPDLNQIIMASAPAAQCPISAPTVTYSAKATPLSSGNKKPETWANLSGALYFYNSQDPYYEFTNFWQANFTDNFLREWPTSEHYFQAHKSTDPNIHEIVRQLATPRDAFLYFRENPQLIRNDWDKKKIEIMKEALEYKFSQNQDLKALLLSTGNRILIEDAKEKDKFWGAGPDMKGENWLGRLLMQLRTKLQKEAQAPSLPTGIKGKQEQ